MTATQMPVDPAGALSDPATSAEALRLIAYYHPELRQGVIAHPNAYAGLIEWLDSLGDAALSAAIAAHRAQAAAPEQAVDEGAVDSPQMDSDFADEPVVGTEGARHIDAESVLATLQETALGESVSDPVETSVDFIDDVPSVADELTETQPEVTGPVEFEVPVEVGDEADVVPQTGAGPEPTEVLLTALETNVEPIVDVAETAVLDAMPEVGPIDVPAAQVGEPVVRNSVFPAVEPLTPPVETALSAPAPMMGQVPMPGQGVWGQTAPMPTPMPPVSAPAAPTAQWAGPTAGMGGAVPGAAVQWPQAQPQPEPQKQSNRGVRVALILLSIIALALLGVAAWTFTNGFGTQNADVAEPQSAAPTTTTKPQSTPAQPSKPAPQQKTELFPAPASARTMRSFQAPSGNIHCVLGEEDVQCQIYETNWAGTQYDACGGQAGGLLSADGNGAKNVCGSGDLGSVEGTLDYGSVAKYGHSACQATQDGISCWNTVTGYSFALARQGWMTGSTGLIEPQNYTF